MTNLTIEPWHHSAWGRYVIGLEQNVITSWSSNIFGRYALQVGMPEINYLASSRIKHCLIMLEDSSSLSPFSLCGQMEYAPLKSESIDLMILPHTLEQCHNQSLIAQEVFRVLAPNAGVIILGFNPHSLWFYQQKIKSFTCRSQSQKTYTCGSLRSVTKLFQTYGLEVRQSHIFGYQMPFCNTLNPQQIKKIDKAGDRWFPFLGAIYAVELVKKIHHLRLVGLTQKNTYYNKVLKPRASNASRIKNKAVLSNNSN